MTKKLAEEAYEPPKIAVMVGEVYSAPAKERRRYLHVDEIDWQVGWQPRATCQEVAESGEPLGRSASVQLNTFVGAAYVMPPWYVREPMIHLIEKGDPMSDTNNLYVVNIPLIAGLVVVAKDQAAANEKAIQSFTRMLQNLPELSQILRANGVAAATLVPVSEKKSKVANDEEEEAPKKKKKVVAEDDDDSESAEDAPPKKRKVADDDDDDDEPAPKKKKVAEDDDEEPAPKKKKAPVEDDDDEPAPKKRKVADDDDEEEPAPKKRKVADDDDDEPAPKKKKVADDDDDDEPAPKKKNAAGISVKKS